MIFDSFEEWISSPSASNDEKQLFKIEFAKKAYNICEEKNEEKIKALKKQVKALEEEIEYLKANPEDASEEGV